MAHSSRFPQRDVSAFFHGLWDQGTETFVVGDDGIERELRLNFHRVNLIPSWTPYAADLAIKLGWQVNTRIAVAGATFGMLEEVLRDNHGFTSVVSVDDSRWIQNAKNETEDGDIRAAIVALRVNSFTGLGLNLMRQFAQGLRRASVPILDEDFSTPSSRTTIKNALGGQADAAFTDDLLDFLTEAQAMALDADLHEFSNASVQHAVGPAQPTNPDRPSAIGAAAWKALLPNSKFYDWATGQVL